MPARRTALSAVLSGVLMAATLAQPASAAPEWTGPRYLSTGPVERFDVAGNDVGDAVAAWEQASSGWPGGEVSVVDRRAGGRWGRPQEGAGELGHASPIVTLDREGTATLVTLDEVRTKSPGGTWTDPYRYAGEYSSVHEGTTGYAAAADPRGRTYVFHRWADGGADGTGGSGEVLNVRPAGGDWRRAPGMGYGVPVIGGLNVVHLVTGAGTGTLHARSADAGSAPTEPVRIALGYTSGDPRWHTTAERTAYVVAALHDDEEQASPSRITMITKAARGPWQATRILEVPGAVRDADVTVAGNGAVTVAWVDGQRAGRVMAITRTPRGRWGRPVALTGRLPHPSAPELASDGQGNVLAAWSTDDRQTGRGRPQTAYRPVGGAWQAPHDLASASEAEVVTPAPQVTATPGGVFTVIYTDNGRLATVDRVDRAVAPRTAMTAPRVKQGTQRQVTVAWEATTAPAPIRSFDLRLRSARVRGAYTAWEVVRGVTVTSRDWQLGPGRTTCFQARARNTDGVTGPWSHSICRATATDERRLNAGTDWRRERAPRAYGTTLTTTRRQGATLTVRGVKARQLSLVVRSCPGCGRVRVFHGGKAVGTVDLSSRKVRHQRVLPLRSTPKVRTGRLAVRVLSRGKPVPIDGFIARR